jgi:hypothetical protein
MSSKAKGFVRKIVAVEMLEKNGVNVERLKESLIFLECFSQT